MRLNNHNSLCQDCESNRGVTYRKIFERNGLYIRSLRYKNGSVYLFMDVKLEAVISLFFLYMHVSFVAYLVLFFSFCVCLLSYLLAQTKLCSCHCSHVQAWCVLNFYAFMFC